MGVLTVLDAVQSTQQGLLDDFLHLRFYFLFEDVVGLELLEIPAELFLEEHVALDVRLVEILIIGSNRIIGQVNELIADLLGVVIDG